MRDRGLSGDPWCSVGQIDPTPERTFSVAMITGHRPQHLDPAEQAWSRVVIHTVAWRLRAKFGLREAISGLALGADTWWAEAALASGAQMAAYIPFLDQPKGWDSVNQAVWAELRARADREVVSAGYDKPGMDARMYHARNDAMMRDTAAANGLVVALYKPRSKGGTASVVAKARQAGRPLLMLDPTARTITRENW